MVLGSMCRNMMRRSPAPAARAAWTYSFSRRLRNTPRTMRARPGHDSRAMMSAMRIGRPWPRKAAAMSSTASSGTMMTRSAKRIRIASIQPR